MRRHARPVLATEGQGASVAREVASDPSVAPLTGDLDLWVSPAVVRERIGAWAYAHAPEAERPAAADVRRALAVAAAVAEAAHAVWRVPNERPLWEVAVPGDEVELARRSGLAPREIAGAMALLLRAGAVVRVGSPGAAGARVDTLCLTREVLEAAPAVVDVDWDGARARLETTGTGAAAALAVRRELGRASGPVPDAALAPYVRYSVRELEAATLFGRSTVSEALGALERAQLITLDARRGQTMRCALAPAAFGHEAPPPADAAARLSSSTIAQERPPAPTPEVRGVTSAATMIASFRSSAAPVLVGEFAGTPIYAPPGTPLVVECDAQGCWSCRVGPFLRLGPIAPEDPAE